MANSHMTFGVDLLPKTTNTYTLGNSNQKWKIYLSEINGTELVIPAGESLVTTDQLSETKIPIIRLYNG